MSYCYIRWDGLTRHPDSPTKYRNGTPDEYHTEYCPFCVMSSASFRMRKRCSARPHADSLANSYLKHELNP